MIIFDNNVFTLSEDMVVETVTTPLCRISVIDNFYKDFDKVYEEIQKLPVTPTDYNCEDMFDGRKSYTASMVGTQLPYVPEYQSKLTEIITYDGELSIDHSVLINVNQPLTDRYKDFHYNTHKDNEHPNSVATLIFLNESYEEGEGFNTFSNLQNGQPMWIKKGDIELNSFFQAQPNRAIVFSTDLNHGAAFHTTQFETEPRYTQIIFANM